MAEHSVFLGVILSVNQIDITKSILKSRGSWALKDKGDRWKHGECANPTFQI